MIIALFIVVIAIGVLMAAIFTKVEIPILKKKQFGQYIREEGPQSHLSKQGTPTMGGVAIYLAIIVTSFVGALILKAEMLDMLMIVVAGLLFGLIGFLDDFIKVAKKHNLGLRAWQKLVLQIIFSVILAIYIMKTNVLGSYVWIPFADKFVNMGWAFVPFVVFVMVAMTNAVNLTDGLDGLCGGVTAIVAFFFGIVSIFFLKSASSVYCMAMCGACIGFLIFNHFPAKIFMGDTGSMSLGAGLTAAVLLTKSELLLPIAGFVFVMEAASVIIQVVSFKTRHKRVFRMSPIHHHFELGGMHETKVVKMFYIITIICCAIGVALFCQYIFGGVGNLIRLF